MQRVFDSLGCEGPFAVPFMAREMKAAFEGGFEMGTPSTLHCDTFGLRRMQLLNWDTACDSRSLSVIKYQIV